MDIAADAPQHNLPWIITFGPLDEDEDWEPVVCGPYERPHALALAQHVVADAELMAVVEPLLPATSLEEIKERIGTAQREALEEAALESDDVLDSDYEWNEEDEDHDHDHDHAPASAPSADEIKAAFARISARLTQGV
jgi:hypothetical protein